MSDDDFEKQIERFRTSETDMAKFCVGYTGIGKTTSLRHCFDLGVSNEAHINTLRKEVIFPTFLDGYQISDMEKFDLSARIAAVCTKLEEENPNLRNVLKTDEGKKDFYTFIRNHTAFALENIDPIYAMDIDENQLIIEKLKGAYKESPFEFQANRLKYYIKMNYDKYQRLVIVLDDIESLPENCQRETISKYLKLYSCMKNTDYPESHKYSVNLLISVRPHTYRILNTSRHIETYPISEPAVLKKKSVDLDTIFERRFNYYTEHSTRVIGNIDTWKICYNELMKMNRIFEGKYKDMIKNLCFMNIREALAQYSKVFANRFWVQKNKNKDDVFTITAPEYSFNNINVIRALACNEDPIFCGTEETIIPNIFYTSEEEDLSIYCLLIMKYFFKKRGIESYGLNAEKLGDIIEEWKNIFGENIVSKFIKALQFLFERKILRKSIKDFDDIKTLDTKESLNDNSRLYISPRGYEMFEMIGRDSVLLEMLRESAWRDYENRKYSQLSSSELMKQSKQDEIFKDLLEYIDYLCEMEDDILSIVKVYEKRENYKKAFGQTSISLELLKGVKNSLDYSGIIFYNDISHQYRNVKAKGFNLMKNF